MFYRIRCILLIFLISYSLFFLTSCSDQSNSDGNGGVDLPLFTNVLNEAGIKITAVLGQTAAWGDFNNDGFLDLVVTNNDFRISGSRNVFLYENKGDGTFSDMTGGSGIVDQSLRSVAWGDFNNDNLLDLVVGTSMGNAPPILYKNMDGNTFVDITSQADVTKEGGVFHATWVDYDIDGLIDIFQVKPKLPFLYHNEGDETFREVSGESGIGNSFFTNSAIWFDINNDGYPDLFLANDGLNTLYKNNKDGTFTDITDSAGLGGDPGWDSIAACVGDYDGDGFFDLYVGNIGSSRNALYKNNGDESFTDVTIETGTQDTGDGRTCSWVDFDGDGRIDLFTTNHLTPTRLFRNLGDGKFVDVATQVGIDSPIDVFAASWGDYNNDGFMDTFLHGHLSTALMENGGNNTNFIVINLIGDGIFTNTSAIGTRVEVKTSRGTQIREVSGGKGCCENDMLPVHFGVGGDTEVDILVKWSGGGECFFDGVDVDGDRIFTVMERDCELIDR